MGLRKLSGQKAYWHLLESRRRPSAYDIGSSRLHYYPSLGFGVDTPVKPWYEKHQLESAFKADTLAAFADPRRTTYASYTKQQEEAEAYLNGVLNAASAQRDAALDPDWLRVLDRVFAPLRFPVHALMMLAAYLSSMAPESRVTIAAAFQAADEIRRVHALARRLHQLRLVHPGLGGHARETWLTDSGWQGLRSFIERALVVYDWSECFVLLERVLKPALDRMFIADLASAASAHHDITTAQVLEASIADTRWHENWSGEMLALATSAAPATSEQVRQWTERWQPQCAAALAPLASLVARGSRKGSGQFKTEETTT